MLNSVYIWLVSNTDNIKLASWFAAGVGLITLGYMTR